MSCVTLWSPWADNSNKMLYVAHWCTLRCNYQLFSWIMQKVYKLMILTTWNRVLLEKLIVSQLVKKFPTYYGTQRFVPCLQELTIGLYPEPDECSPSLLPYFLNINANIIVTSMLSSSTQSWGFPPKLCMHFSLHACRMLNPSHPPWVGHPNNIWWGVQVMKLLIMQFSPVAWYFFSVTSRYLP